MHSFTISRLHLLQGIFKISGAHSNATLQITSLHMMSSDGWVLLDLQNRDAQQLITTIQPALLQHLLN